MELALFPIAALLLLFSGAGSPSSHGPGSATIMRALLANVAGTTSTASRDTPSHLSAASGQIVNGPRLAIALVRTPPQVRTIAPAFARKQYRTRFGSGAGAYFAVGPPATVTA